MVECSKCRKVLVPQYELDKLEEMRKVLCHKLMLSDLPRGDYIEITSFMYRLANRKWKHNG